MSGEADRGDAGRLERALAVWMRFRETGAPGRDELLAAHPDLRDVLTTLLADADGSTVPPRAAAAGEVGVDDVTRQGAASETAGGPVPARFRIERELGRGGMGVVFAARDTLLDRRVALKVLGGDSADPAAVERLRAEAAALARLDHPGIVRILAVGVGEPGHWIAMDLVEGEALDQRLRRVRSAGGHAGASLREMVQVVLQVAEALASAHAAGVVHRDVKPSNILVRPDGRAVLVDFGLARSGDAPALTRTGAVAGTPHYLAPERLRHGVADAGGDVFALGVVLYEVVTLARPFDADDVAAVMHRILTQTPRDPRRWRRGVSPDLCAIIGRALEKDPAQRYPGAIDLALDLRAFLDLRAVSARPITPAVRLWRWCRREPLKAVLAGALAISVPALAGLGGVAIARRGLVVAGVQRQREQEIERLAAEGFRRVTAPEPVHDWREPLEAMRALDPESGQAALGIAAGLLRRREDAAARTFLDGLPPALGTRAGIARLRAAIPGDQTGGATRPAPAEPQDALDHLASCLVALVRAQRGEDVDLKAALEVAARGERLWPEPDIAALQVFGELARRADNARAVGEAATVLLHHFGQLAGAHAMAGGLLVASDPERARRCLERAVAMAPDSGQWQLELALCCHAAGQRDAARAAIDQALARNPRLVPALVQRGVLLQEDGQLAAARAVLEEAVRAGPDHGRAWCVLGRVRQASGDLDGALVALRRAILLLPDEQQAHQSLVTLLTERKLADDLRAETERWAHRATLR